MYADVGVPCPYGPTLRKSTQGRKPSHIEEPIALKRSMASLGDIHPTHGIVCAFFDRIGMWATAAIYTKSEN